MNSSSTQRGFFHGNFGSLAALASAAMLLSACGTEELAQQSPMNAEATPVQAAATTNTDAPAQTASAAAPAADTATDDASSSAVPGSATVVTTTNPVITVPAASVAVNPSVTTPAKTTTTTTPAATKTTTPAKATTTTTTTTAPTTTTAQAPAVNARPVISGTPATSVTAQQAYLFKPTASDPEGKAIGFSITNKPSWATFSTVNGQLSGTPAVGNVGTYAGVVISVSDGTTSTALPAFTLQVVAAPNNAPTITGTPATAIASGSNYNFVPAAADANSDALTFSITNKPAWATFDTSTGRLSGTPTNAQSGSYANIVISVSDGKVSTALTAFTVNVTQVANGSAALSWTPPTENTDGSALSIAAYRIYYGTNQSSIPQQTQVNAGITSFVAQNLSQGTYYFAITVVDISGVESEFSSVASKNVL